MKKQLEDELIAFLSQMVPSINGPELRLRLDMILAGYEVTKGKQELEIYKGDLNENMLKRFLAAKIAQGCSKRTITYYRNSIKMTFAIIGKLYSSITADDIRLYLAKRIYTDKVSKSTANNERRNLSAFYGWLQMITRAEHARLNQRHLRFKDPELTKTGITVAKILTAAGSKKKEKKKMTKIKKIMALLLVLIIMASVIPAQAAVTAPAAVKTKATQLMRESGMDVAFVVKLGADRKGTGYMFYRNSRGKVICDRYGQVILGKNTPYKKSYTYRFYRNFNFEYNNKVMKWKIGRTQYEQAWPINIECDQVAEYSFLVHGYVRYKEPGRTWKACKGASRNTDGLAMCQEFARYLRSCADDGCPVAFM